MNLPCTSAEADWPRVEGQWVTGVPGATRALDLRPTSRRTALPDGWTPTAPTETPYAQGSTTWLRYNLERVPDGRTDQGTYALTLTKSSPLGPPPLSHDAALVVVLLSAKEANSAHVASAQHGLYLPYPGHGDPYPRLAHLEGIHTALCDPDGWADGLAGADLTVDENAQREMRNLLTLAHPTIATSEQARPFAVLRQVESDAFLLYLLSNGHQLPVISATAHEGDEDDTTEWCEHLPIEQVTTWQRHGPYVSSRLLSRVATLARAGWQPPTLARAWDFLPGDGDEPTTHGLDWLIGHRLDPMPLAALLAAGMSPGEIDNLVASRGKDLDGLDWDVVGLMSALHAPSALA